MSKRHSISDIAKIAGVSVSTVSRVLNDSPGVSDEKRHAVQTVIQSLEYYPSALVQSLVKTDINNTSKTIGLIVPNIRNPFFAGLASEIHERLLEKGYMLSVFNTFFNTEQEKKCIDLIKGSKLDGLIINSSLSDEEAKDHLLPFDYPITLLDRVLEGSKCNSVIQDNFHAGYLVTKHLLELGHNNIVFIAGLQNSRSSMDRVEGYRKALQNSFISVDESKIFYGSMNIERGRQEAIRLMQKAQEDRPSAVVMANDETAVGFIDVCKAEGISIPEKLSVVSFDDISIAGLNYFDLTTIHQSISEMSKAAIEITLQSIENPTSVAVRKLLLQPKLIIRNSTQPAAEMA